MSDILVRCRADGDQTRLVKIPAFLWALKFGIGVGAGMSGMAAIVCYCCASLAFRRDRTRIAEPQAIDTTPMVVLAYPSYSPSEMPNDYCQHKPESRAVLSLTPLGQFLMLPTRTRKFTQDAIPMAVHT